MFVYRTEPLAVTNGLGSEEHDQEGRLITAEYPGYYGAGSWAPRMDTTRGLTVNTQHHVPSTQQQTQWQQGCARGKDRSGCAACAVVSCYVPNSGEGLKRLEYRLRDWDMAFAAYLGALGRKKPVILTGDLNCAHQEIDIHAPKRNLKSAGFTPVRASWPATATSTCP